MQTTETLDRSKIPVPSQPPKVEMGSFNVHQLENGMHLIFVQDKRLPQFSLQVTLDLPPILEGEHVGCAELTGKLLKSGTENRSKETLNEEVDFMGASLFTFSHGLSLNALSKYAKSLFEIAADVLLHPALPEEELEKLKVECATQLKATENNPDSISGDISAIVNHGKDHPYGEVMNTKFLVNITREKCRAYYDTYFSPDKAYAVVIGDLEEAEVLEYCNTFFGSWNAGQVPQPDLSISVPPLSNQLYLVDRPEAVQTRIALTYPIQFRLDQDDFIAAHVMNNLFGGGGFSSRLMQNIREDKGYTYGIYSRLKSDEFIGNFSCSCSVANEVTAHTIQEVLKEIERMITEPVEAEELQLILNKMSGEFALNLEHAQTLARFALNTVKYKLPEDHYALYLQKLQALTPQDIQKAAKRYLQPHNMHLVLVGNKSALSEQLESLNLPVQELTPEGDPTNASA